MANKSMVFPTINKNHIKDTFNLYNQVVRNAMKYQSAMLALATAINELSASYNAFMTYAPMKAIIESSGQQTEIHNSLKIYRILYESFKKMSEFLNRDFALPLNDDFKSMQNKFNDKKIEKTLKLEEKQRTRSLLPGVTPEPSNIQRGLFQQYISAIKFVSRKTKKLQNYEIHVFQRMVQGILSYEDMSNTSFINQSMSRDVEETPRLNYQSYNKKSILDVSQLDNGIFDESILKGMSYDKNPLTNSFIRDEVIKSEKNGDGKYFPYSNHSPVSSTDNILRDTENDKMYDNEMDADVNNNQGGPSDYSKHDYHQRYTSTPNIYEMKYYANKYEDKSPSSSNRSRSKSLGGPVQATQENFKKNHLSMPAVNKNNRFSTPANHIVPPTPSLGELARKNVNIEAYINSLSSKRVSSMNGGSFNLNNQPGASSGTGKSSLSQSYSIKSNENELDKRMDNTNEEEEENEEANTTITEHNVKKEKDTLSKIVKKTSFKKNFSDMKNMLHKRRSSSSSSNSKPVSILKKRSATFSAGSSPNTNVVKNENLSKVQDIMKKEEVNDDEEFIVISKKKMDTLIRTGKVHSIDDIIKNKTDSIISTGSEGTNVSGASVHTAPSSLSNINTLAVAAPNLAPALTPSTSMTSSTTNDGKDDSFQYPLNALIDSPENDSEKDDNVNSPANPPREETNEFDDEPTPRLAEKPERPINNRHTRTGSYGGISQSHIRGMQSNLAAKNISLVPNGYATPMLSHQEPGLPHNRFGHKTSFPIEYATPMLSRFNNTHNYSPMLESDVPSVNPNDDITPPRYQKAKSTINLQNLLNNWPDVEALTKPKENLPPIVFSPRKNSLPNYNRKGSLDKPITHFEEKPISMRKGSLDTAISSNSSNYNTVTGSSLNKSPITIDTSPIRPTLMITKPEDEENEAKESEEVENKEVENNQKKKGVNWDDNNKEYLIPNSAASAKSNDESYFDDTISKSYVTDNEESSMMINDPTRLIFSKFNTSLISTNDSTIQSPIEPIEPFPFKKETKLSSLRNIITQEVLNDELPPTPVSPVKKSFEPFEPSKPTRGESLHFKPKIEIEIPAPPPEPEKTHEEREEEIINNLHIAENEDGLITPFVKMDNNDDELLTPIAKADNHDELLTPIEKYEAEGIHEDQIIEESTSDSEDEVRLVDIPRFNKKILNMKMSGGVGTNEDGDEEVMNGEEEGKEKEQEQKNDYTVTKSDDSQTNDPFNYNEEPTDNTTNTKDDTENPEISDVEDEVIEVNELEVPKKVDRKDSVKSVISNFSSKFSQKFNSMFSSSESTAVNNSENDSASVKSNKNEVAKANEEEKDKKEEEDGTTQEKEQEQNNEVSVMTEITEAETTMDDAAFKENIEEQKEELAKNRDVFTMARKLSSDFIKGGGELIRRSSKESLKSLSSKFSLRSRNEEDSNEEHISTEKPEEMEAMKKSNSIKFPKRNSNASLKNYNQNQHDSEESQEGDDRSIKTCNTVTSASLPRKDSLIRAASIKKQASVRSVVTVATTNSNLTSTPIINSVMDSDDESIFDETPKVAEFPERPQRNIPARPDTPMAPNTPVFPNIKLCNILRNHEEPSSFNLDDKEDVIVISNPLLEVTNNKNLADYKNDLPDEQREFRISRNEAYMTFNLCQNDIDIESVMGSIVDPDEDSIRMDMLNNESSLSFRSINPHDVYEENNSVILTAPKLNNTKSSKKPTLQIDTIANTSKVVAIIPSPIPQKDNNFAQKFNNLNAASIVREQQNKKINNNTTLKRYVALYPYNARDGRELSFQRADVINVRREQGEWVYGYREDAQINGEEVKYGWVPKSYLKIISMF